MRMNSDYTMLISGSIIERPGTKKIFCLYFMAIVIRPRGNG